VRDVIYYARSRRLIYETLGFRIVLYNRRRSGRDFPPSIRLDNKCTYRETNVYGLDFKRIENSFDRSID